MPMVPTRSFSLSIGTCKSVRAPPPSATPTIPGEAFNVRLIQQDILDLDRLFRDRDTTEGDLRVGKDGVFLQEITIRGRYVPLSDGAKLIFFIQEQHRKFCLAEAHGVLQHRLEDRLQFSR